MITPSCRPALWAMTAIYGTLLKKIEDEPSQIITRRRVRLGAWRKGMIAMRAKWFGHPTGNGSL
jgi:phytoene/squalene synthetase